MSDTGESRQSFIRVSLETAVHSFVLATTQLIMRHALCIRIIIIYNC